MLRQPLPWGRRTPDRAVPAPQCHTPCRSTSELRISSRSPRATEQAIGLPCTAHGAASELTDPSPSGATDIVFLWPSSWRCFQGGIRERERGAACAPWEVMGLQLHRPPSLIAGAHHPFVGTSGLHLLCFLGTNLLLFGVGQNGSQFQLSHSANPVCLCSLTGTWCLWRERKWDVLAPSAC